MSLNPLSRAETSLSRSRHSPATMLGSTAGPANANKSSGSKFKTMLDSARSAPVQQGPVEPESYLRGLFQIFGGGMESATRQASQALGIPQAPRSDMVGQMAQMNAQFLALQNTMHNNERRGGVVKEVLTVRHHAALNSIQKMV